jgi:hypothetical protein
VLLGVAAERTRRRAVFVAALTCRRSRRLPRPYSEPKTTIGCGSVAK